MHAPIEPKPLWKCRISPLSPFSIQSLPHLPRGKHLLWFFSVTIDLSGLELNKIGVKRHVFFCIWLPLLNILGLCLYCYMDQQLSLFTVNSNPLFEIPVFLKSVSWTSELLIFSVLGYCSESFHKCFCTTVYLCVVTCFHFSWLNTWE